MNRMLLDIMNRMRLESSSATTSTAKGVACGAAHLISDVQAANDCCGEDDGRCEDDEIDLSVVELKYKVDWEIIVEDRLKYSDLCTRRARKNMNQFSLIDALQKNSDMSAGNESRETSVLEFRVQGSLLQGISPRLEVYLLALKAMAQPNLDLNLQLNILARQECGCLSGRTSEAGITLPFSVLAITLPNLGDWRKVIHPKIRPSYENLFRSRSW
jgi:hypothetical protein